MTANRQRKQHSDDAGYIAERANPIVPGTKVVICRWGMLNKQHVVTCKAHNTSADAASLLKARLWMRRPDGFCEECRAELYRIMEEK